MRAKTLHLVAVNAIVFICIITTFLVAGEIYLRANKSQLSIQTIALFPDSAVRQEILGPKPRVLTKRMGTYDLKIPLQPSFKLASEQDVAYGAVHEQYFNVGFCNKNTASNSRKVISIGDSFTFCTQVTPEEAWIRQAFPDVPDAMVFNGGRPGLGPFQYNQILAGLIQPETEEIFYAYYEGNDFRDILRWKERTQKETPSVSSARSVDFKAELAEIGDVSKPTEGILGYSYIYNYLLVMHRKIKMMLREEGEIDFRYFVNRNGKAELFNNANSDTDEAKHARLLDPDENENALEFQNTLRESLMETFSQAQKIADTSGAGITFLYIPSTYSSFDLERVDFVDPRVGESNRKYSELNRKYFSETCSALDLTCLDVTDAMRLRNECSVTPTHFPTNNHLSAAGHKVVAESIVAHRQKVFPKFLASLQDC